MKKLIYSLFFCLISLPLLAELSVKKAFINDDIKSKEVILEIHDSKTHKLAFISVGSLSGKKGRGKKSKPVRLFKVAAEPAGIDYDLFPYYTSQGDYYWIQYTNMDKLYTEGELRYLSIWSKTKSYKGFYEPISLNNKKLKKAVKATKAALKKLDNITEKILKRVFLAFTGVGLSKKKSLTKKQAKSISVEDFQEHVFGLYMTYEELYEIADEGTFKIVKEQYSEWIELKIDGEKYTLEDGDSLSYKGKSYGVIDQKHHFPEYDSGTGAWEIIEALRRNESDYWGGRYSSPRDGIYEKLKDLDLPTWRIDQLWEKEKAKIKYVISEEWMHGENDDNEWGDVSAYILLKDGTVYFNEASW